MSPFLALDEDGLLAAAALLLLLLQWGRGWVEPVTAPPEPRHIAAQQILALCLQEHRVGDQLWKDGWGGLGPVRATSYELARAVREVLLGAAPPVALTRRAQGALAKAREENHVSVHADGAVVTRGGRETNVRWWTWAGHRANATLAASLGSVADPLQRPTGAHLRLREDVTPQEWAGAKADAAVQLCLPAVDPLALTGLKFSTALPPRLAEATLAARLADLDGAADVLRQPTRFFNQGC
ncbi:hypothetical protein ACWDR0_12945 [Streptomyces sp. NPDC003691]